MTLLMNRLLTRIAAPAGEPVSLSAAKAYLRIEHDDDDALIDDLIVAARMSAEHWLRRALMTQSWRISYDECFPDRVQLPMVPIQEISVVRLIDSEGADTEMDGESYYLNAAKDTLVFNVIPAAFRVEIEYVSGYGDASAVPAPIKQGMLFHIAHMYDCRGDAGSTLIPPQTAGLYMPFREVSL